MGTRLTRLTVVAALSATAVLGACSSGPQLSRAGFIAKANEECASLEEASDAFRKAQDPAFEGAEVRRFVHRVSGRLRELVRHVDALVPPDEMEDDVDRLLADLAGYADGLDELADRTQAGQTFHGVIQASPKLVGRMNDIASRVSALVGDLGLVDCILPS